MSTSGGSAVAKTDITARDGESMPQYSVRCIEIHPTEGRSGLDGLILKRFGPLWLLSIFGAAQSVVLLALAITYRDGMGILAVALLSVVSSLACIGHKWSPGLSPTEVLP